MIDALPCSKALSPAMDRTDTSIMLPSRVSNKQLARTVSSVRTSGRLWWKDRTLIAKLSMVTPQEKVTSQDILWIEIMSQSLYMDVHSSLYWNLSMWKRSVSLPFDHLECDLYAITSSSRTSPPTSYLTHLGRVYLGLRGA